MTHMKKTFASLAAAVVVATGTLVSATPATAAPRIYTVKLSDYAKTTDADATAGVNRALVAVGAKGGGTIFVDGIYTIKGAINIDSIPRALPGGTPISVNWEGTSSSASGFRSTGAAPIFLQADPTPRADANGNRALTGQYRYNWSFKKLHLEKTGGSAGRIFDYRTGAMVNTAYENLQITTNAKAPDSEVFYMGYAHQAHGNLFKSLRVDNRSNSSFLRVVSAASFFNNNRVEAVTVYTHDNKSAPCIELRPNGGNTNNSFVSVTGQNCAGGFIHAYGQSGLTIQGSSNWDLKAGTQYRDTIRLGRAAGTHNTTSAALIGLGRVEENTGAKALMAGRHLIALGDGTTGVTVSGTAAKPVYTKLTY